MDAAVAAVFSEMDTIFTEKDAQKNDTEVDFGKDFVNQREVSQLMSCKSDWSA